MTSKEFVISKVPDANATYEHEYKYGRKSKYFYIRKGTSVNPIGTGKTESAAWTNAKKNINTKTDEILRITSLVLSDRNQSNAMMLSVDDSEV